MALFGLPRGVGPHYQGSMTLSVTSPFDGGNIRTVATLGNRIDLEIVKDHASDFYQWFYFRLTGGAGREVELRIVNCAGAAYPLGWQNYRACMSVDREEWERVDTRYDGGILSIRLTAPSNSVWFAYFAPYTMERHHDLVASVAGHPPLSIARSARHRRPGDGLFSSAKGRPNRLALRAPATGEGRLAEWWMEGALERLLDEADPVARRLLARGPSTRPQHESRRLAPRPPAHQRRRTQPQPRMATIRAPSAARKCFASERMDGPESISRWTSMATRRSRQFLAGFDGHTELEPRPAEALRALRGGVVLFSPDFQTRRAMKYRIRPGNMRLSTAQLAERFGPSPCSRNALQGQ